MIVVITLNKIETSKKLQHKVGYTLNDLRKKNKKIQIVILLVIFV